MARPFPFAIAAVALFLSAGVLAEPRTDAPFTIAVIPDTQNYLDFKNQKNAGFPFDASQLFLDQMSYVAAHSRSQGGDIAFVTSVGDVWQHQTSNDVDPGHAARGFRMTPNSMLTKFKPATPMVRAFEMPLARRGYGLIAGKLPFGVVAGNQDYDAIWTDARHPPRAFDPKDLTTLGMLHVGGLNNFKSVFGSDSPFFKGKPWYVAAHDDGADSAQIFSGGGYRFLHIALQFNVPDGSLRWAAGVLRDHPGLPTIVTTHDCLNNEGKRLPTVAVDKKAVDPEDNNPEDMWQKLISQNDQIFMVLCGHHPGQAYRVDDNRAGHKVYQVMADYQRRAQAVIDAGVTAYNPEGGGGDGWLRLITFTMTEAIPTIRIRTYSTHYNSFSSDLPDYARWYKASEKPHLTDEEFLGQDDFVVPLTDFRARFGKPGTTHEIQNGL